MSLSRRVACWLVSRRELHAELRNLERLSRERLILLCASESEKADQACLILTLRSERDEARADLSRYLDAAVTK